MTKSNKTLTIVCASALGVLMCASPAAATISIVGVDSEAGEVGIAVASCVPASFVDPEAGTSDIAALVPGVGAGISQALLNSDAPPEISRLLIDGASADEVITRLISVEFDDGFDDRQHAVVTLDGVAAGFTGAANSDVAIDLQAPDVSVQGNILVSEAVALDALAAFEAQAGRLAEKLVDALVAASEAGGDSRCESQTALFAHVAVAGINDSPQTPPVLLWATVNEGTGENPILLLADEFRTGNDQVRVLNATTTTAEKAIGVVFVAIVALIALALIWIGPKVLRRSR